MEICDVCRGYCDERGDETIHEAEGLTFCSCCIIWYEESKRKARIIELVGLNSITLTRGELLMIYDGMRWKGFLDAQTLMMLARRIKSLGRKCEFRMGNEGLNVNIFELSDEISNYIDGLDPPEGFCPLGNS